MKRDIFEVYAKVVDANGAYNTLSGYPKVFDSKNYDNNSQTAHDRAYGEYHSVLGTMYTRSDRQVQIAMIIHANTGLQVEMTLIGEMAELPEPTEDK